NIIGSLIEPVGVIVCQAIHNLGANLLLQREHFPRVPVGQGTASRLIRSASPVMEFLEHSLDRTAGPCGPMAYRQAVSIREATASPTGDSLIQERQWKPIRFDQHDSPLNAVEARLLPDICTR